MGGSGVNAHCEGSAPPARRAAQSPTVNPGHLWWAVPLALAAAVFLHILAAIAMCGISGCTGGGFGRSDDLRGLAVAAVIAVGLVMATPLYAVRWTASRRTRLIVALVVGVATAAGSWLLASL